MPKQRPPEVEPLPSGAPRSPDEAATEPPTPMDRGVPATPVGGAPSLMPPPATVPVSSGPPPESARSKQSSAGKPMQELVGPNPSMRAGSLASAFEPSGADGHHHGGRDDSTGHTACYKEASIEKLEDSCSLVAKPMR